MSDVDPELLDRCLTEIVVGKAIYGGCAARHLQAGDELAALLQVARAIGPAPAVEPDPFYRARGRASLLAAIAAERRPAKSGLLTRAVGTLGAVPRRLALPLTFVLAFALSFGSAAAALAAQEALPNDGLYGVKSALEAVQVQLAFSAENREGVYLELADRRLAELEGLAARGRLGEGMTAAWAYVTCMEQAQAAAATLPPLAEGQAPRLQERLARQVQVLGSLVVRAPASAQPALLLAHNRAAGFRQVAMAGWRGGVAVAMAEPAATDNQTPAPLPETWASIARAAPLATRPAAPASPTPAGTPIPSDPTASLNQVASAVANLASDPSVPAESQRDLQAKVTLARTATSAGQPVAALEALGGLASELNTLQAAGRISPQGYEAAYKAYAEAARRLGGTAQPRATAKQQQPGSATASPPSTPAQDNSDTPTRPSPTGSAATDAGEAPSTTPEATPGHAPGPKPPRDPVE